MKRTLSLVLALVMVLGSFGAVFAADTVDGVEAGDFLELVGVLTGDENGDLMLDDTLLRRDMVVMLSRLMGAEDAAKEFAAEDLTFQDVSIKFYESYVAWAVENGLIKGHSEELFGFNEDVTAQQYATVLMRALKYEVEGDAYATVLEDAVALGLLAGVDVENNTAITRAQMAVMTVNTLDTAMKDSETTLAESLKLEMPAPEVTDATEVEDVYADNLVEVVVVFDGEVDKTSAEDKGNYSLDDSTYTVEKAKLNEELNTVVLTLDKVMDNQKEYELTISNVKAGAKKLATEKIKFTTLDNILPEVLEVKALGTKALKVVVSEPLKEVKASNFKMDGKNYFGSVDYEDGREITLKPYNTNGLEVGNHTLAINGLVDYNDFKSLKQEFEFTVVEDNDAPVVVEVNATLEKATVIFDEDVNPNTVNKNNFYWKSGSDKQKPDTVKTDGNEVTLEFNTNKLPAYKTTLYIINVADYSGNKMVETEFEVKAEVDQGRPEVVNVEFDEDDNAKLITVKFNKGLQKTDAEDRGNYEIKDEDGDKISVQSAVMSLNKKEVALTLYKNLPEGINTLTISGVSDNTTLKNVMLPVTFEIEVGDTENPTVKAQTINDDRKITITFSEKMDAGTLVVNTNYLIKGNGSWRILPSDSDIDVFADGKIVVITLPKKIDGKKVVMVDGSDLVDEMFVNGIQVVGAEDLAGNSVVIKADTSLGADEAKILFDDVYQAILVDKNTIEIEFDQPIIEYKKTGVIVKQDGAELDNPDDYTLDLDSDGKLIIKLAEGRTDTDGLTVDLVGATGLVNNFKALSGGTVADDVGRTIEDEVAPEVDKDATLVAGKLTVTSKAVTLKFTENLAALNEYMVNDLEVIRVRDDKVIKAGTGAGTFELTKPNTDELTITITGDGTNSYYTVRIKDDAKYIMDSNKNIVLEFKAHSTASEID